MTKKDRISLMVLLGSLLVVGVLWRVYSGSITAPMAQLPGMSQVRIGNNTVNVDVAATDAAREQGLSGRTSLQDGTGMLFVFDKPGDWGIWMKDMNFSIDILWAASDGTILTIASNVSPGTYPRAFYPDPPIAAYVLELPANYLQQHGIAKGQKIVVK